MKNHWFRRSSSCSRYKRYSLFGRRVLHKTHCICITVSKAAPMLRDSPRVSEYAGMHLAATAHIAYRNSQLSFGFRWFLTIHRHRSQHCSGQLFFPSFFFFFFTSYFLFSRVLFVQCVRIVHTYAEPAQLSEARINLPHTHIRFNITVIERKYRIGLVLSNRRHTPLLSKNCVWLIY